MQKAPSGWAKKENELERVLTLGNFREVVGLINKIAEIAERLNHHPDLEVFGYKNLRIKISTHETAGLTEKDFKLAEEINALLKY